MNEFLAIFIVPILAALIAGLAYLRKSLDLLASFLALAISSLLALLAGNLSFIYLISFFVLGSLSPKLRSKQKSQIEAQIQAKGQRRDSAQVLANSMAAIIMGLMFYLSKNPAFYIGLVAAFAGTTADTLASEIGMLSQAEPFSLLRRKKMPRGMSGAVTKLGLLASLLGSSIIALIFFLVFLVSRFLPLALEYKMMWSHLAMQEFSLLVMVVIISGFAGSLIDSLLGEIMQAKYRHHESGNFTEQKESDGQANLLVAGFSFMTNDLVNFISSLFASIFAYLLAAFLLFLL